MAELTYPIPIVHVLVDDANGVELKPSTLYVFWAEGAPVGQHFTGTVPDLSAMAVALREARRAHSALVGRPAPAEPTPSPVTVVICTRDGPEELARCLRSFRKQTRIPDQVVVVDNASRDKRTREVALAAGAEYVREDRPGLDLARSTGARAARGRIVAYTNDDVVLHPRWLERLVMAFDAEEIWAVTGLVLPAEFATEAQWQFERCWRFGRGFRRQDFSPELYESLRHHGFPAWEIGAGASMAFRRRVFDTIGYFDERLDVGAAGSSGDSEFWNRILHHGGTCRYEPSAGAFHFHRRDCNGLRHQLRAYMSGHVAALLIQHERTGERGNLRRLVVALPRYYLRKIIGRMCGCTLSNTAVVDELRRCLDGIVFYLRAKRPVDAERREARKATPPPQHLPRDKPLVGVVVPACNAAATLDKTLRSIRAQTYERLEIVVVDDGSLDDTASIARSHAAEDTRVRVIVQENRGVAAARNRGIEASTASLIAPVDADDLCHPEKFERQVRAFQKAGSACGLVYGWSVTIDELDRITAGPALQLHEGYVVPQLLLTNFIGNGSSPMMRRSAILECGGYDPGLKAAGAQGCEDLKLYLQIAERYDFAVVPLPLTGYRMSSRSMSADVNRMIRSHRLVVEPYAQRYPEYKQEVWTGHIFIAMHYIRRELRLGHFGHAFQAFHDILHYGHLTAVRALLRTPISLVSAKLTRRSALERLGASKFEHLHAGMLHGGPPP